MKKIVIDARNYSSSTGRYTRNLIKYLEAIDTNHDHSYEVLLFNKDFDAYTPNNKNFSKQVADFSYYGFAEQTSFLKFLNSRDADVVHFTLPQQPVLYRKKAVTSLHDLTLLKIFPGNKNRVIFKIKQIIGSFVFKRIAKTNEYIITPTKFTQQEYIKFSGSTTEKVVITYEAADKVSEKLETYKPMVDKKYIMYVGQQSAHKNLRKLMAAHQLLIEEMPDLQLVLVGKLTDFGQKNKAWAADQNYKNIVFTDFVPDSQLAWLYKNTAAYVFPSLMEGFGLPPLEAMHYDAPVISSNATCMPEVLGDAAVYFDPLDEEEMASQIKKVLLDPTLQKKLITNGKKQLKKYSWKRMAEQTLDIYKKALDS